MLFAAHSKDLLPSGRKLRNQFINIVLQISSIQFLFYIIRIFKSFQNCHFKIQLVKMSTRIIEYNITGNHKKQPIKILGNIKKLFGLPNFHKNILNYF